MAPLRLAGANLLRASQTADGTLSSRSCAVNGYQKALQAVGQMKQGKVIDLTEPLALRASLISLKHHLPMADSFILSTTWSEQATLWTQDEHFSGLPGVEYIKPRTKAPSVRGKPRR